MGIGTIMGYSCGYGIIHPGTFKFVFGIDSPWIGVGLTVSAGTSAAGFGSGWKFDYHWTTAAGGGGTTEYSTKELDKKASDAYDNAANSMRNYYYRIRNVENSFNTMVNSFRYQGVGYIRKWFDNFYDNYFNFINKTFIGLDIMIEPTTKEKTRKAIIEAGEYYGSKYGGEILGGVTSFISASSPTTSLYHHSFGVAGYAIGSYIGNEIGGLAFGALFDLLDISISTYIYYRRIKPKLDWIEIQNRIYQNQMNNNLYP